MAERRERRVTKKKEKGRENQQNQHDYLWRTTSTVGLFMPHRSQGNNIKTEKGWPDTRGVARTLDPKTDSFPKKPTERDRTDVFPLPLVPFPSLPFHIPPLSFPLPFSSSFIYSHGIGSGNASGLMSTDNAASS